MTLHDFNSAKRLPEEYSPGWQIMSNNYKTSFLYGTKTINLSTEVYSQAIIFRDYFRPIILNDEELPDEERYLFPSWKATNENPNHQLTASAIANILTQTFKDAKVYNVGFCDRFTEDLQNMIIKTSVEHSLISCKLSLLLFNLSKNWYCENHTSRIINFV